MPEWPRVSWLDDDPARLERELAAMPVVAPDLSWNGRCWTGHAPLWPFERPHPDGLLSFVGDRRLQVEIFYLESFPMVAPRFMPVDPEPDISVRTRHDWHVNGDGSLCMFQNFSDWDPFSTAADLVPKASGWFLEYLLLSSGRIDTMTVHGIVDDDQLDHFLVGE